MRITLVPTFLILLAALAFAGEDEGRGYHALTLEKFAATSVRKGVPTHVSTSGIVKRVRRERDGDRHISLCSSLDRGAACVMLECIPRLPCARVRKGQTVEAHGITRFDYAHHWWEIHPVESLRVIPATSSLPSKKPRRASFSPQSCIAASLCD